ncbi:14468_t:CDS:2 [Funneliformis geosporum]|uniref:30_t:CDS:1 n=1 Tax=Funneliformis geosporum TaxID=1117311 RepID=A0A9W4SGY0_9GLOM|nr:30_t:CDS:2 [Funneliformis geosporum]CAI2167300.1 14468_t:CDS:2 [Funneliformis geosporum]
MDYSNFADPLALILQDYVDSDEEIVESKSSSDQILSGISTAALSDSLKTSTSKQQPQKKPNLTKCQNCDNDWKYKCPKCDFRSCSLDCCKLHKEKYSCNGIRSKVEFVSIEQYGYKNLMSDYVFLEDVSRTIDSAHRYIIDNKRTRKRNYNKYSHTLKKKKFNKRQQG